MRRLQRVGFSGPAVSAQPAAGCLSRFLKPRGSNSHFCGSFASSASSIIEAANGAAASLMWSPEGLDPLHPVGQRLERTVKPADYDLLMAPSSHGKEPPRNLGLFRETQDGGSATVPPPRVNTRPDQPRRANP